MKKNKIAAAALALTLGLGALAPTLASADEAKKAEAKSETKSKKEKLTAVRDKATEVLAAAKLLVQLAPDTIKPVEAKLNALVEKQEKLIKAADEALAKLK